MNGKLKLHKPNSPAFNAGEVWIGASGSKVEIISVVPWPVCIDTWSYSVHYRQADGSLSNKDAWAFQVRYTHTADQNLKVRVRDSHEA